MTRSTSTRSKALALIGALSLLAISASADGIKNPITANMVGGNGIDAPAAAAVGGTPCSDGQLDFSDGCNTTLYMVLLR